MSIFSLLGESLKDRAVRQGLLGASASLLSNSGPSLAPKSTMSNIGQAIQSYQSNSDNARERARLLEQQAVENLAKQNQLQLNSRAQKQKEIKLKMEEQQKESAKNELRAYAQEITDEGERATANALIESNINEAAQFIRQRSVSLQERAEKSQEMQAFSQNIDSIAQQIPAEKRQGFRAVAKADKSAALQLAKNFLGPEKNNGINISKNGDDFSVQIGGKPLTKKVESNQQEKVILGEEVGLLVKKAREAINGVPEGHATGLKGRFLAGSRTSDSLVDAGLIEQLPLGRFFNEGVGSLLGIDDVNPEIIAQVGAARQVLSQTQTALQQRIISEKRLSNDERTRLEKDLRLLTSSADDISVKAALDKAEEMNEEITRLTQKTLGGRSPGLSSEDSSLINELELDIESGALSGAEAEEAKRLIKQIRGAR